VHAAAEDHRSRREGRGRKTAAVVTAANRQDVPPTEI